MTPLQQQSLRMHLLLLTSFHNLLIFFFQAEDGIRDGHVTGVQTCALPILPCTAPSNTLLAALNASNKVVDLPKTARSFSLGMVINESTRSCNSLIPASATTMRLRPSKGKGLVTTATVRIPRSRATSATTGAPPVPVPPPIPAAINTMSAPRNTSAI